MTLTAFLLHLGFATFLLVTAALITRFMLRRVRILDHPGERSSHSEPIPRSGGVAVVFTFFCGAVAIAWLGEETLIAPVPFFGFVIAAIGIGAISLYDDITQKSFQVKMVGQVAAAAGLMASGVVIERLAFPAVGYVELAWLGYPITLLWLVGLTNAYNFMDGLDGLASGVAVITAVLFGALTFLQGSLFAYIVCYTVAAGAAGFLLFNFPPAKIFMGDVGSAFLGFVFAALAIIAANHDAGHTSFLVMPLLLFTFLFDTVFTFVRRLAAGKNVFEAHREHLYQLLNRTGWSHRRVALLHYALSLFHGVLAWWMVTLPGEQRLLAFVPALLVHLLYAHWVMQRFTGDACERGRNGNAESDWPNL